MSLTANERLAMAGYALSVALFEGGTDATVRYDAVQEARKHLRAVLRQSADGKDFLAGYEPDVPAAETTDAQNTP